MTGRSVQQPKEIERDDHFQTARGDDGRGATRTTWRPTSRFGLEARKRGLQYDESGYDDAFQRAHQTVRLSRVSALR